MRPLLRRAVRWLGVDRNPLRRGTDRIESAVRIALVLAFLVAGPMLAASVGLATDASGLREVRAERAWHQVTAVLTRPAPHVYTAYGAMSTFWVPARWHVAPGRSRTGLVPTAAGSPAGATVGVWVDKNGRVTGHQRLTADVVTVRVVIAAIVTLCGVAIGLVLLAGCCRWLLNRRRLARWAIEWAMVGPRWTTRR